MQKCHKSKMAAVDQIFREANVNMNGHVRYEDFVKIACAPFGLLLVTRVVRVGCRLSTKSGTVGRAICLTGTLALWGNVNLPEFNVLGFGVGLLWDLLFPLPLHSGTAPCSPCFTLKSSALKTRPCCLVIAVQTFPLYQLKEGAGMPTHAASMLPPAGPMSGAPATTLDALHSQRCRRLPKTSNEVRNIIPYLQAETAPFVPPHLLLHFSVTSVTRGRNVAPVVSWGGRGDLNLPSLSHLGRSPLLLCSCISHARTETVVDVMRVTSVDHYREHRTCPHWADALGSAVEKCWPTTPVVAACGLWPPSLAAEPGKASWSVRRATEDDSGGDGGGEQEHPQQEAVAHQGHLLPLYLGRVAAL
ncbi:hypothetical protein PR048_024792, partial [Dryococelus australis]